MMNMFFTVCILYMNAVYGMLQGQGEVLKAETATNWSGRLIRHGLEQATNGLADPTASSTSQHAAKRRQSCPRAHRWTCDFQPVGPSSCFLDVLLTSSYFTPVVNPPPLAQWSAASRWPVRGPPGNGDPWSVGSTRETRSLEAQSFHRTCMLRRMWCHNLRFWDTGKQRAEIEKIK